MSTTTVLTPKILDWLTQLEGSQIPNPPRIRIEYDQASLVGSALIKMGYTLERVRVPPQYHRSHGGYKQKWTASDYLSPEHLETKLRVVVVANATHRPLIGSVRVEKV